MRQSGILETLSLKKTSLNDIKGVSDALEVPARGRFYATKWFNDLNELI